MRVHVHAVFAIDSARGTIAFTAGSVRQLTREVRIAIVHGGIVRCGVAMGGLCVVAAMAVRGGVRAAEV